MRFVGLIVLACLVAVGVCVIAWPIGSAATSACAGEQKPLAVAPTAATQGENESERPARDRVDVGATRDGVATPQRVRVLATWSTGGPAAAAEVRYWPVRSQAQRESEAAREPAGDLEVALRASGRLAIADARGVAEIEAEPGSEVCVRVGGAYGEAALAPDERELRIELQRDVTLRVQVADVDGRPREGLDVAVSVRAASRRAGSTEEDVGCGQTDATGQAVLPHAQRSMPVPGADVIEWRMVARCKADNELLAERAVGPADLLAAEPIRMVVPVGGTVVVDVVDPDGRSCWAGVDLEDPIAGESRGSDRREGASWFRQVPLGRQWSVHVCDLGVEIHQPLVGPARADDVVRTRIEWPLRSLNIQGRIVRADGMPVGGAEIVFAGKQVLRRGDSVRSRDGSLAWARVGDFRIDGALPTSVLAVDGATLRIEREPYCAPCTIRIERTLHPGDNDLGDVVVPVPAGEELLASVEVRCEGRPITATAWARLKGQGETGINSVQSFAWHAGDMIALCGPRPGVPLALACGHQDCVAQCDLPIRLGEHKVVDLQPAAKLKVTIVPPAVPSPLMRAELGAADGRPISGYFGGADEDFEWRELAPGRYALRFFADQRLLLEVPAIDLHAGTNVWPADGAPLDLRRSVSAIHLDLRTADGDVPIDDAQAFAVAAGAMEPPVDRDLHELCFRLDHAAWFVPLDQPTDMLVTAKGFVPVRVSNPTADTTVRMQRCTTLRLTAPTGPGVTTIVRVVDDAVRDPWLRRLDEDNQHEPFEVKDPDEPIELAYAPGTVVEVVVVRADVDGPAQRVTLGVRGPVEVDAR